MEFTFDKKELLRVLRLLELYVIPNKYDESPESYFGDKVVFRFIEKKCKLSVYREDVHVHIYIPYEHGKEEKPFSMDLLPLIETLEHISYQQIKFEEDTFFGFLIYSSGEGPKKFIHEIRAYSTRKIKECSKQTDSFWFDISKREFVSLLNELYEYTDDDYLSPNNKYVWFYGNGKEYMAAASDGHKLAYRKGQTYIDAGFRFGILGKEVPFLSETLTYVGEMLQVHMENEYNIVYGYDKITGTEINILHFLPDVSKWKYLPDIILSLKSESVSNATVCCQDIVKTIRRVCIKGYDAEVFLHFINGHVNIHFNDDDFKVSFSEFYDTQYCDGDFVIKQKARTLSLLLERINTISVRFCIDSRGFLHVLRDNEEIFGDSDRFSCGCLIETEEKKMIERKDFELARDNGNYRNLYFN